MTCEAHPTIPGLICHFVSVPQRLMKMSDDWCASNGTGVMVKRMK